MLAVLTNISANQVDKKLKEEYPTMCRKGTAVNVLTRFICGKCERSAMFCVPLRKHAKSIIKPFVLNHSHTFEILKCDVCIKLIVVVFSMQ